MIAFHIARSEASYRERNVKYEVQKDMYIPISDSRLETYSHRRAR